MQPDQPQRAGTVDRVLLLYLAAGSLMVGAWAQFAPRSFYEDFPAPGRAWVSVDGPFNEHLIRDVGGLNLGLTLVTVVAAITLGATMIRVASIMWLAYALPHFLYHLFHLDGLEPIDQVGNVVTLSFTAALPLLLLWRSYRPASEPEAATTLPAPG